MQSPNTRLILIGIANSIDLTERTLPRLQATGCRPALVTFPSYSSLQLECLLQQRLAALPGPVFQPQAVRLAAKKVGTLCTAALRVRCGSTAQASHMHSRSMQDGKHAGVQGLCRLQYRLLSMPKMPCELHAA